MNDKQELDPRDVLNRLRAIADDDISKVRRIAETIRNRGEYGGGTIETLLDCAENAKKCAPDDKTLEQNESAKSLLNRVHEFLGKVVRDCQDDDMSVEASNLADEVWNALNAN